MARVLIKRVLGLVPLLFLVSLLTFGMTYLIPGDPAVTILGENATPENIAATRERLHLNDPLVQQYTTWATNAMRGDFGQSLYYNQPVMRLASPRLPVTLSLAIGALVVALVVGVPAGIVAALHHGRWVDRAVTLGASVGVAIPGYWLGLVLLLVFAIWQPWFPTIGYVPFLEDPWEWLRHLLLPATALGASAAAELARQLRGSLVDVLHQDYVRTARAKGIREWLVVGKHALKNAAAPALTVVSLQIAVLLGGAVIIEQVFSIPGVGQLALTAIVQKDIPVIQAVVVLGTVTVVFVNLLVDLVYSWLNPKVRIA